MDLYAFYRGLSFNAEDELGAALVKGGVRFRTFAPNAEKVSIIGEFNGWNDTPMQTTADGNFYEITIPEAKPGMMYKYRIYEKKGRSLDRSDPYAFRSEGPPHTASIVYDRDAYRFSDARWMRRRTTRLNEPLNIYEVHIGSWRDGADTYRSIAAPLAEYLLEHGFNYVEFMPLCEYPADSSWGYQATGFFAPTARYGTPDDLKYLVDYLHQKGIGVLIDFPLTHFAVDDFGLADYDGSPLYEYPHPSVGYNEWGSKNFNYGRGEVRSFLQSAVLYWLQAFHFDGIRMDAIRNLIYWQGDTARGENRAAIEFLQVMNKGIKEIAPDILLIAEDSSAYPKVTSPVDEGGLGFDYKWDMGWMNDTLSYFQSDSGQRRDNYHKLTFSMHYFYNERFLLPLSHDEVVHGKATVLQKMNGYYEAKFPQARAFYLYMYTHPGKKLNFMGNEIGHFREWDERREQDWNLLDFPIHAAFLDFFTELSKLYLASPALWERDFSREGFRWLDCREGNTVYSYLRTSDLQTLLAVFNFGEEPVLNYRIDLEGYKYTELIFDSNWQRFGGTLENKRFTRPLQHQLSLDLEAFSGKLFYLARA